MSTHVPAPAQDQIWCNTQHPFADLVICRRLRHPPTVLHSSTNTDDWASQPTEEENPNA